MVTVFGHHGVYGTHKLFQSLTYFLEAVNGSVVNLCSVEMIVKTQAHKLCFQPIVVGAAFLRARPRHETTLYRGAARKNCDEQSSGQCWAGSAKEQRIHQISGSLSSSSTRSDLLYILYIQYGGNFRLHVKYRGCPFRAPQNQY